MLYIFLMFIMLLSRWALGEVLKTGQIAEHWHPSFKLHRTSILEFGNGVSFSCPFSDFFKQVFRSSMEEEHLKVGQ